MSVDQASGGFWLKQFRHWDKWWQNRWFESKAFKAYNPGDPGFDPKKPKYYVLDMFPYPSGSGLHVGHALGYIATDIVARRKWMEGYNVLHPMGWDAFGLPAEQYAIQTGQHPRVTTDQNTARFKAQLKNIGLAYDWDREIDTSRPEYYRWTQWQFLQFFKKGLVYRKDVYVWWCEALKTVLANEEVINGRSERGNHPCERRPMPQWMMKITQYAQRLIQDLDEIDWPENIKKMQVDWIGLSEGAVIKFPLVDKPGAVEIFTTRADTLMGAVAVVLAVEHPMVENIIDARLKPHWQKLKQRLAQVAERDRKAHIGQGQVQYLFLNAWVKHPITGARLPVYVADYVLPDYALGAVMCVPAHDERDYAFAIAAQILKPEQIPGLAVIDPPTGHSALDFPFTQDGVLNSRNGVFSGLSSLEARVKIVEHLKNQELARFHVSFKLRDWVFSRQRYWGEPIPLLTNELGQIRPVSEDELPVELPDLKEFEPLPDGRSPLWRLPEWVNFTAPDGTRWQRVTDTMPGWAGSCWYFLRFTDPSNAKAPFSREAERYWMPVDLYVGGASHAVMHLLYARFWHKVLYDLGLVSHKEPFKKLFNQGMVTAYAFRDKSGRLVPVDQVQWDSERNGWFHKETGEQLERFVSKMAKSLKNVVNPDDVIDQYGADAFRLYMMFMGPLEDEKPWDDEGIVGCFQFLRRWCHWLLEVVEPLDTDDPQKVQFRVKIAQDFVPVHDSLWRYLHLTLKRVNNSFDNFHFNVAVAAFMELFNEFKRSGVYPLKDQLEFWLRMMHPFAPHVTQQIWSLLGHKTFLHQEPWPQLDPSKLAKSQFECVFQVNGKTRKKLMVDLDVSTQDLEKMALQVLEASLKDKKVIRVIVVPGRLVNVVVQDSNVTKNQ